MDEILRQAQDDIKNKRLVGTEEAAKILGVNVKAIHKRFERGKLEGELKPSDKGGGKSGMKLYVYINDRQNGDSPDKKGDSPNSTPLSDGAVNRDSPRTVPKSRTRVGRGEPGCHVVTPIMNGMPIQNTEGSMQKAEIMQQALPSGNSSLLDPSKEFSPDGGAPTVPEEALIKRDSPYSTPLRDGAVKRDSPCQSPNLPVLFKPPVCVAAAGMPAPASPVKNSISNGARINPNLEKIGYLRYAILNAWREELSPACANAAAGRKDHKPKIQVIIEFLQLYNSGLLLPTIYNDIGSIQRATLYSWDKAEKLGGIRALIPQYGGPSGSKITENEKYILLNILLHQNRLKIGSAIKFTKAFLSYKKIESPSSEATLRRYIDEFKRTRYDAWVSAREGAKALNDKCLPYAERNWRLLTVGEGLVADGHRLNFQTISPFTGKKCRATIVLFWDWKSAYLLGWEIMLEESIQCIASALRNAILTLGKIPKWLLIDNGKAFKANVFASDIDLEDGVTYGMFATLGIHTHFSQAYNPQEKPLERFWGTFNNWFERLVPSYTGASIPDKPPYMLRNEKDAQARHNEWVPKIEEVQEMLLKFREFYIDQPSRGRDGKTPREIFEAEKGPGVDPDELTYLMMAKEIKSVGRNGVTWNGWHYYDEALYGYRDKVICRYTHSDYSKIYLFSLKNQFLCVARPVEQVHPMASDSEFPKDQEAVKQISSLKNRVRRGTKNLLTLLDSKTAAQIDWSRTKNSEISETIQKIEDTKKPKAVNISPFANSPEPEIPVEEENKCPFDPPVAWARYEFHLKGGRYRGAEMDKQFMEDFRSGKIAPGLWESLYAEKERLESEEVNDERKVCHY